MARVQSTSASAPVAAICLTMADNDHQSRTLATLRGPLLPKLLSGELSVAGGKSSALSNSSNAGK